MKILFRFFCLLILVAEYFTHAKCQYIKHIKRHLCVFIVATLKTIASLSEKCVKGKCHIKTEKADLLVSMEINNK